MKKILIFLWSLAPLNGASWSTAEQISLTTGSLYDICGVYNLSTQQLFTTWVEFEGSNGFGVYSIFNPNTGWSTPLKIDSVNNIFINVKSCYISSGPDIGKIFAASASESFFVPVSYIYDPNTMSWSGQIPISGVSLIDPDYVNLLYNPQSETVFASYFDSSDNPTFSYYHAGSWSGMDTISSNGESSGVFMAYDSASDVVYAAWSAGSGLSHPTYATYSGSGPWSAPTPISASSKVVFEGNVVLVYNAMLNAIVATWQETPSHFPIYSIFMNGSWSTPAPITTLSEVANPTSQVGLDVQTGYNSDTGQVFATWQDATFFEPYYSILDPHTLTWSVATSLSTSTPIGGDINLTYVSDLSSMFAFWSQGTTVAAGKPFWSRYFEPLTPQPASNLTGKRLLNDFGTESELYTNLQWSPSPSSNILGYQLYNNGILVATLSPYTTHYSLHNLAKGVNIIAVYAFNNAGQSPPVTLVLKTK